MSNSKCKVVQISSFNSPSGISLLANILLELGYYNYIMLKGDWIDKKSGKILFESEQYRAYKGYMPYINKLEDNICNFNKDIEFFWGHQWPTLEYLPYETILLYRDVFDAALSQYKRSNDKDISTIKIENFFDTEYVYLGLSFQDEWALYYLLWMNSINLDKFSIVSYNDLKEKGITTIKNLMSKFDLCINDEKIINAINNSDVKYVLEDQVKEGLKLGEYARKGDPRENDELKNSLLYSNFTSGLPRIVNEYLNLNKVLKVDYTLDNLLDLVIENFTGKIEKKVLYSIRHNLFHDAYDNIRNKHIISDVEKVIFMSIEYTHRLVSGGIVSWVYFKGNDKKIEEFFSIFMFGLSQLNNKKLLIKQADLTIEKHKKRISKC